MVRIPQISLIILVSLAITYAEDQNVTSWPSKEDAIKTEVCSSTTFFNYMIGTQSFRPCYKFTDNTPLVETAQQILDMGSNIFKCLLGHGKNAFEGYGLPINPKIKSLRDLLEKEPSYQKIMNMPFGYYFFWTYSFWEPVEWQDGMSAEEKSNHYKEIYELAAYLLEQYNGSGKTFMLGHWEGDWSLMGEPYDEKRIPDEQAIKGMIDWLNIRQQAVDDAKRDVPHKNVDVFHYTEVNLVQKAIRGGKTVTSCVLPFTNVDYVSYSCYDSLYDLYSRVRDKQGVIGSEELRTMKKRLYESLDYIATQLPDKNIHGKRVFIGEYGFPLIHVKTQQTQDIALREFIIAAIEWGCPFILYWQIYENECAGRGDFSQETGWAMIDSDGEKRIIYNTHKDFYEHMRKFIEEYQVHYGRKPDTAEYKKESVNFLSCSN